jgi:YkoY family integral membrane protein
VRHAGPTPYAVRLVSLDIHVADLATVGFLIVLESLLSADNALVMAVMVASLPEHAHRRALNFGLVGALAFRSGATALAIYLIDAPWLKVFGGLYLLYLSGSHFWRNRAVGNRHPSPSGAILGLSTFWSTVVRVELVNLAFSVDSILVAVAMSTKFWVVLSGGLLGVIAMRVVVSTLVALIRAYPALVDGAFVIIAWVGGKLLLEYAHQMAWVNWEIPQALSLGVVVAILVASYLVAKRRKARPRP